MAVLLGDCDSEGFALLLLLCTATWPIEEMPHGDVAGFLPRCVRWLLSGQLPSSLPVRLGSSRSHGT